MKVANHWILLVGRTIPPMTGVLEPGAILRSRSLFDFGTFGLHGMATALEITVTCSMLVGGHVGIKVGPASSGWVQVVRYSMDGLLF